MEPLDNEIKIIDPTTVSVWGVAVKYGAIGSFTIIGFNLILHLMNISLFEGGAMPWVASIFTWGVMFAAIFMASKFHKEEELGGYISFGRAFWVGFALSLIMAVITIAWTYVFFKYIAPEASDMIMQKAEEQWAAKGLDQDQIEQARSYSAMWMSPGAMAIFGFIGTLIYGLVLSLISSAILQRKAPQPF